MTVVAIGGPSGAGKTCVATALSSLIRGCAVLGTDAYYRDLSHVDERLRDRTNFDSPAALDWDLLTAHLSDLRSGKPVSVPRYDFVTHCRLRKARQLRPPSLLVLEGLFALMNPRLRQQLDLTVFLDASQDECLSRRILRDRAQRGRSESSVRRQWVRYTLPMYRLHVRPCRNIADLVLDATRSPGRSARAIARAVRHNLALERGLNSNQ